MHDSVSDVYKYPSMLRGSTTPCILRLGVGIDQRIGLVPYVEIMRKRRINR